MNRPAAKLTEAQVLEIRARLAAGHRPADIATNYQVTRSAISKIKTGRTWTALNPEHRTRVERCRNGHPRSRHGYRNRQGHTRCRACRRKLERNRRTQRRQKQHAARLRGREQYRTLHAGHDIRPRVDGALVCYSCWRREHDIDEAAVAWVVAGHRVTGLTPAEKELAAHKLTAKGWSASQIAAVLDCAQRTVVRYRARGRQREQGQAA